MSFFLGNPIASFLSLKDHLKGKSLEMHLLGSQIMASYYQDDFKCVFNFSDWKTS